MAHPCNVCGVTVKAGKLCCSCRAYFKVHPEGLYPLPKYGEIKLASNGDIICHECGAAYRKLGNHIAFRHHMTINEYKDKHGIYHNDQLTCEDYKTLMRSYNEINYDKVITGNLIDQGNSTRFVDGHTIDGQGKHIRAREEYLGRVDKVVTLEDYEEDNISGNEEI